MKFLLILIVFLSCALNSLANEGAPLAGSVSDPFVDAQERLLYAKGSYKTIKQQENAIKDMRKATNLSLKAAKLRTRAEKLQTKADILVNKANQQALSRGLYITNPLSPVMMQPPPSAQTAKNPAPIPGQNINIVLPRQEEVSENTDSPPVPNTANY